MHTTHLRKVGGSVMLSVPPAILELLQLKAGSAVGVIVEGKRLIIEVQPRKRYTLDELLSQCDASQPSTQDHSWTNDPAFGNELL